PEMRSVTNGYYSKLGTSPMLHLTRTQPTVASLSRIRASLLKQSQPRRGFRRQRIAGGAVFFQSLPPVADQPQNVIDCQSLVNRRIFLQIGICQLQQGHGGLKPAFLQMHKGAGQLDESFVKRAVRAVAIRQPELLQNIMGFVKQTLIETLEVTKVAGVQLSSLAISD